jgi:hypothetical protein
MKFNGANFLRMLLGIVLAPFAWASTRVLLDMIIKAAGQSGGLTVEVIALLGGMAAFSLCWMALTHPVRTYILGHELTHALWGMLFGARASRLRVGETGGSVNLTKSNMLITLAPYFFPFYTFVVVIAALITGIFIRPLPYFPLWLFLVGFTWAFHVLFTLETLTRRQPDISSYGRIFSWVFIYIANVFTVIAWIAFTTSAGVADAVEITALRTRGAYGYAFSFCSWAFLTVKSWFSG